MALLRFPPCRRAPGRVAEGLLAVEQLLAECHGRRAGLRRDGIRLRVAVRRLRTLTRSMARCRRRLRRSLGRLRACHVALGAWTPPGPPAV